MSVDKLLASSLISSPEGELTKSVLSNIQQIKTFETGMYYMAGEKVYFNDANTSSIKICSKTHFANEYKKDHWQNYDETYNELTQGSIEHSHNITTPVDDVFPMGKRAGYIVPMGEVYKPEPGDNIDFLNSMLVPNISSMAITNEKNLISGAIVDKDKKGFYINTLLHGTYILTSSNAVYKNALNTCVIKTTKLFWNGFNNLPTITPVINSDGNIEITLRGEKIYFSNTGWALTDDFMNATPILFSFYKKEDAKDVGLSSYNKTLNTYPTMILPNGLPTSIIKDKFYKINMKLQRLLFTYGWEENGKYWYQCSYSNKALEKIFVGNIPSNHQYIIPISNPKDNRFNPSNANNYNKMNNSSMVRYNIDSKRINLVTKNPISLSVMEIYDANTLELKQMSHRPVTSYSSTYEIVGNKIYMIGGQNESGPLKSIYSYDITTNKWEFCVNMAENRYGHVSFVYNNKIYILAGTSRHIEEFNPSNNTITTKIASAFTNPPTSCQVEINGDKIYIFGGNTGTQINNLYIYNITSNTLTNGNPMISARSRFSSVIDNGKIYAFGGNLTVDGTITALNSLEIYNISTGVWSAGTIMPGNKAGHTSHVYNNKIYTLAGTPSTSAIYIYDIISNTWSSMSSALSSTKDHNSILIGSKIYVFGGEVTSTNRITKIQIFDIENDTVNTEAQNMPIGSVKNSVIHKDGKLYVFQGPTTKENSFYADVLLPDSIETKEFSDEFDPNYNSIGYLYNDNSSDTNLAISSLHPKDLTLPYNMTKAKSIVFKNELYNFLHKGPVTNVNVTKLDLIKNKWDSYNNVKTNQMDITPVNVKINGEETIALVCNVSRNIQTDGSWNVNDSSGELVIDATIGGNGWQSKLGKNLFSGLVKGIGLNSSTGIETTDSKYATTGYIPINIAETYILSGLTPDLWNFSAAYDSSFQFIGRTGALSASSRPIRAYVFINNLSGIPVANTAYIRFTIYENVNVSGTIDLVDNLKVQLEAGSVDTPYEPYTPNPTSEAPIMPVCLPEGTRFDFVGENIFDKTQTAKVLQYTNLEQIDTGIRVTVTLVQSTCLVVMSVGQLTQFAGKQIKLNVGGIYASGSNLPRVYIGYADDNFQNRQIVGTLNSAGSTAITIPTTFTPLQKQLILVFYANVGYATPNIGDYVDYTGVSVKIGADATTDYVPYTNPTTLVTPCDLWATPASTKDDLNFTSGIQMQKIYSYTFTGNEAINLSTGAIEGMQRFICTPILAANAGTTSTYGSVDGLCSHLPYIGKSSNAYDCCYVSIQNINLVLNTTDFPDAASVKSMLLTQAQAGTPVTIWYPLATPKVINHPTQPITLPKGICNVIVKLPDDGGVLPSSIDIKYKNQIKLFKNNNFSLVDWVIPFNFEKAKTVAYKEFIYVFPEITNNINSYFKLDINKKSVEEIMYAPGFRSSYKLFSITINKNYIYMIGGILNSMGSWVDNNNYIRRIDISNNNMMYIYIPNFISPMEGKSFNRENIDGSITIFTLPETLDRIHCLTIPKDSTKRTVETILLSDHNLTTRNNAMSAMYNDNIIIMGGVSDSSSYTDNDILIFNTKNKTLYNPNIAVQYPFENENEKKRRLKYLFGEVDSSKLMKASSSSSVNQDVLDDINSSISSLSKELKDQISTVVSDTNTSIAGVRSDMTDMENRINASSINASRITGIIDESNLPKSALERLVNVANKAARFALTTATVQLGDTVKENDTKNMYLVKDITKLNSEDGYEPYTASTSSDSSKFGGKTPDKYVQRDINTDQLIGTGAQKLKINTAGAYPVVGIGDKNITANSEAVTIDKVATNKVILNDKIDIVYNSSLNAIEFNKR